MAQLPPTLKRGSKGDRVLRLQDFLKQELGYNVGPIDGAFGPSTENAVKEFQRDRGLVDDGIVGQKTWEAIETALSELRG
jgi:peptidoglycan hydrolase-like protein with peptidoglycan-binding domain